MRVYGSGILAPKCSIKGKTKSQGLDRRLCVGMLLRIMCLYSMQGCVAVEWKTTLYNDKEHPNLSQGGVRGVHTVNVNILHDLRIF